MTMTASVEQPVEKQHSPKQSPQQQQQQHQQPQQYQQQQELQQHDIATMEEADKEGTVAASREITADVCHNDPVHQQEQQQQKKPEANTDPGAVQEAAPTGKVKKSRRRRGGKGRWKPYHKLSLEEKIAKEEKEERNAVQKRERLFSRGKPMAPYNTTQFLLEDHEKRTIGTIGDSDGDSGPGAAHRRTGTGRSPIRERRGSEMGGNTTDTASYSGAEEDDEMERQFDADYDYVNLERIGNMNKEEVTQEYMHLEKNFGKLADRVSMLQWENEKLKQLLTDHNIAYEDLLPTARRRHSGTSVSEASEAARKSFEEVPGDSSGQ